MAAKKILICGLTGSGKTTLANILQKVIGGVVLDGDDIRNSDPNPVGFSAHDRWLHARRMGKLADIVTASGNHAICSFVCPTSAMREAFAANFVVWIDREGDGLHPDTKAMFENPGYDLRVHNGHDAEYWAGVIGSMIEPVFHPRYKTALMVGRFQPFHAGHKALAEEAIKEYGQVCFGVRDTDRYWAFDRVKQGIEHAMRGHTGLYNIVQLPNIAAVVYGRDVGYKITQIHLPSDVEKISGTEERKKYGYPLLD